MKIRSFLTTLLYLLAPLPAIYFLAHFYFDMQALDELESSLDQTQRKIALYQKQEEKRSTFLSQLDQADHFFLDKQIETIHFSESSPPHNRLLFAEEALNQDDTFLEVEERQQFPVYLNEEELKRVLSLVEGVQIGSYLPPQGRPQLLIKQFNLSKREGSYQLNMQLIKREKRK